MARSLPSRRIFTTHLAIGNVMSYWLPALILAYMPSIESKLDSMILTPYSFWKPLSTPGSR